MSVWIAKNEKGVPNLPSKGPLVGRTMPFWTQGGITVFIVEDEAPFENAEAAIPGMVGVVMGDRHKQLHIIDVDGEMHALPYRLEPIVNELVGDAPAEFPPAILESASAAAHDAWLAEKLERLRVVYPSRVELSWKSETGEEQLVPWVDLSEPVREFDRIVVRAIIEDLATRGLVKRV